MSIAPRTPLSEVARVARRIKRLDERREYLWTCLNNDPMSDGKRAHVRAEWSALDWALRHIEKTREIAIADARAKDEADPELQAAWAARRAALAAQNEGADHG